MSPVSNIVKWLAQWTHSPEDLSSTPFQATSGDHSIQKSFFISTTFDDRGPSIFSQIFINQVYYICK